MGYALAMPTNTLKHRKMPLLCSVCLHVLVFSAAGFLYHTNRTETVNNPITVNLMAMAAAPAAAPMPETHPLKAPVKEIVKPVTNSAKIHTSEVAKPKPAPLEVMTAPEKVSTQPAQQVPATTKAEQPSPIENTDGIGQDTATIVPLVQKASIRSQVPPIYPARARQLGMQGTTLLHALVEPSGEPSDLKIVQSSGYRLLDDAALAAVRQWVFEPTDQNGSHQKAWVAVPVEFVLSQN